MVWGSLPRGKLQDLQHGPKQVTLINALGLNSSLGVVTALLLMAGRTTGRDKFPLVGNIRSDGCILLQCIASGVACLSNQHF
jgi:hypothetical protein